MTPQEVFNKVWNHFITEGNPRSVRNGSCSYRGDGGARCAIGLFIPDEEYQYALEGWNLDSLMTVQDCEGKLLCPPSIKTFVAAGLQSLLTSLQDAHDGTPEEDEGGEILSTRLRKVAVKFQLEVPSA